MAVPVWESFTSANLDNAASGSITYPASIAAGDLLLFMWECDGTNGMAVPTGFTLGANNAGSSSSYSAGWAYKIAAGTETGSLSVATVSGSERAAFCLARISGVDTSSPIHQSATNEGGSNTSAVTPSVTTTILDSLVVRFVGSESGNNGNPIASWPTSTERYDNENGPPGTFTASAAATAATASKTSAGATGTETCDLSARGNTYWRTYTIAVGSPQEGITAVTSSGYGDEELDFDDADVDVDGLNFEASQGSGTVYISDADTLAGSANEVEIAGAVNTWSDTQINLDFSGLSSTEVDDLHTLGPGARYLIVVNNSSDEYSFAITLHRPHAVQMVAGSLTPGTTTQRLSGMSGTFGGGRAEETAAQNPSTTDTDVASDGNREDVWSVQMKTGAREVTYDFRLVYTGSGAVADTITQTPQVTFSSGGYSLTVGFGSFAVTGQDVGLARSRIMAVGQGSVTVSGRDVALSRGRRLAIGQGSFAVAGQGVSFARDYVVAAAQGSVALAGHAVGLVRSRIASIDFGSFAVDGRDVALARGKQLVVGQGAIAVAGQVVALRYGRTFAVGQGSFAVTGQSVGFLRSRILTVGVGAVTLDGRDVGLAFGRVLAVGQGSVALTGQDVALIYTPAGAYTLAVGFGSFAVTGQDVGLARSRIATIEQGSVSLNGQAVALLRGATLPVGQGDFAVDGRDVGLLRARLAAIAFGTFTLDGRNVQLNSGHRLAVGQGGFAVDGRDVTFVRGYAIAVEQGAVTVNGQAVTLSYAQLATYSLDVGAGAFQVAGQDVNLYAGLASLSPADFVFRHDARSRLLSKPDRVRTFRAEPAEEIVAEPVATDFVSPPKESL